MSYDSVTVADSLHLDSNGIDAGKKKIKNLDDAENDDEAVTYKQLKNYSWPYFSVKLAYGMFNEVGNVIQIGYLTKVEEMGMAIGYGAKTYRGISIGMNSYSKYDYSIAFGDDSIALDNSIAIGKNAKSYAAGKDAIAYCPPTCGYNIAIGKDSESMGDNSIAIGNGANVWSPGYAGGTAIGYKSSVFGQGSVALGANSKGHNGVAINGTAIGAADSEFASPYKSVIAISGYSNGGMTMGGYARNEGIAIGDSSSAEDGGIALGYGVRAEKMAFPDEAIIFKYYDENGSEKTFDFAGAYTEWEGLNPKGEEYGPIIHRKLNTDRGALTIGSFEIKDNPISLNKRETPGGRQIHALAPGRINATSTDGVNGSQLYGVITALDALRKRVEKIKIPAPTEPAVPVDSGNITAPPRDESLDEMKDEIAKVKDTAQKGWRLKSAAVGGKVESDGEEKVKPGDEVIMEAGKNIVVKQKQGRVIHIATDSAPTFEKVTSTGEISANGTIHANGGITVAPNQVVNMGGNQVTNVAEGVKPNDAVNKAQLDRVAGETVRQVGRVERKIDQVDRKLRAGIAGATAIAFLQQPSVGGKSLVSMSVGGYRNQQAVAVGYGRNSDNNKVTFKVGGSVNSQGDMNWGGSVGYQW